MCKYEHVNMLFGDICINFNEIPVEHCFEFAQLYIQYNFTACNNVERLSFAFCEVRFASFLEMIFAATQLMGFNCSQIWGNLTE